MKPKFLNRATAAPVCTAVLLFSTAPASHAAEKQSDPGKGLPKVPVPDASAAKVPEGYKVDVVMTGLTYATSVEFDGKGTMYVAEAGYSYGDEEAEPRIIVANMSGKKQGEVTEGLEGPINDLLWHDSRLYISHRGKIAVLQQGKVRDLVTGLPSDGDHQNNQLTVGPDGKLYFGQGTATNSGVVGMDNSEMGWLKKHPNFHDIPAQEIKLTGRVYETKNPLSKGESDQARTSSFHSFGKAAPEGATVSGQVKASGTILRMNPDGSGLEVYAWGLRNPFGVMWGPDGKLYVTENGLDVRGSRPIANDKEDLYVIKEGSWYGWPDYGSGIPVTDPQFKPEGKEQPQFLMKEHPPVEKPLLTFPKHSAVTKLAFSPGRSFGFDGQMFVAFFGHMAPMTGKVEEHGGHRVVRIDPANKKPEVFFTKKGHHEGDQGEGAHKEADKQKPEGDHAASGAGHGDGSSGHEESASPGPRRLVDVQFSPEGDALYVVDFGAMFVNKEGTHPVRNTGVLWRISRTGDETKRAGSTDQERRNAER